jgi:oligosaccharide reducing-end xylanase
MNIDGAGDEWTSRYEFESRFEVFGKDTLDDSEDLSAWWRVAWDETYLYLFADVRDDVSAQVNTGASIFEGDAVAIYFDGDRSDDAPDAQLSADDVAFFFAPVEAGQNWVKLIPSATGGGFASEGALTFDSELRVVSQVWDGGYTTEIRIPWRLLGVSDPQAGQRFRMTLDVSDNDSPGESQQDAMISNSVNRTIEGQAFPAAWEEMILEAP